MKSFINRFYNAILAVLGLICLVFAFVLGLREGSQQHKASVQLLCSDDVLHQLIIPAAALAADPSPKMSATGKYVGSKNGTKYYAPSCSAAKRIKAENYVWFKSADDAKLQGYTPGNC